MNSGRSSIFAQGVGILSVSGHEIEIFSILGGLCGSRLDQGVQSLSLVSILRGRASRRLGHGIENSSIFCWEVLLASYLLAQSPGSEPGNLIASSGAPQAAMLVI